MTIADWARHYQRKFVPTDMDWAPTFAGGFAEVTLYGPSGLMIGDRPDQPSHMVSVHGNDDTSVCRHGLTFQQALDLYNSLTYLKDLRDLRAFEADAPIGTENNNGWPYERRNHEDTWNEDGYADPGAHDDEWCDDRWSEDGPGRPHVVVEEDD